VQAVPGHDVALVRAANPGPLTLTGTNTWIVGRDPCWIVDPGPALAGHVDALVREAGRRGGVGGIALTHDHADHVEALDAVRRRMDVPAVGAAGPLGEPALADGDRFGPLRALATPGHAPDHLAFVAGGLAFTGDAVLGAGSVFVAGQLADYLAALRRLRALDLSALCPGHGPVIAAPASALDALVEHRLERERRIVAALDAGARTRDELLDRAWGEIPAGRRRAAAATLAAHLDKLADEGRLPADLGALKP
jgi:glyoxylase-like metal-dependent hydrolase (beta-lactamase superfamily II)